MSTTESPDADTEQRRKERLRPMYELEDELKLVAESDCPYAEYAENWLESLREVGYDV